MLVLFTALSLLTGTALLVLAYWLKSRSQKCQHWPTVMGSILESRIDDSILDMIKPVLRFRYEVNGQSYEGFRVSFSGYGVSRSAMEKLILPYPQGSSVKVYYNPKDPALSVLNNTQKSDWLYWLVFGIRFLFLAAYLVLK